MNQTNALPSAGFVRLPQIIGTPERPGPIPVSKARWYQMIAGGEAPKPIKLGKRASAWRVEEIRALIARLSAEQGA